MTISKRKGLRKLIQARYEKAKRFSNWLLAFLLIAAILASPLAKSEENDVYTIGWFTDTQNYVLRYPETFYAMTNYLKENRHSLRLGYVVMTGDLVDNVDNIGQWKIAQEAMNGLGDIPYGVLAGNHDKNKTIGFENYENYFGEKQFSERSYYGGSYLNNQNHFDLITLGTTDYIFVYLSFQPGKKEMAWANEAFAAYEDRVGVLCVHDYLNVKGTLRPQGEILQKEVVFKNPNIYMVLCGHKTAEKIVPVIVPNQDGTSRVVYQCIANYQSNKKGGGGYIRFLEIDEEKSTIHFYTRSPLAKVPEAQGEGAGKEQSIYPIPWEQKEYSYLVIDE